MNKRRFAIGMLLSIATIAIVQTGVRLTAQVAVQDITEPPACEWDTQLFPMPANSTIRTRTVSEVWSDQYHQEVSRIIAAHQAPAGASLSCEGQPERTASAPLKLLAEQLYPWKTQGMDAIIDLNETEMGSVLLEYQRMYRCALQQRSFPLASLVLTEMGRMSPLGFRIDMDSFQQRVQKEQRFIATEPDIAKKALNRTLAALAGRERLQPLTLSMECLVRASTDITNELGLSATVSACLPARTWDTKGSFLALPQE